MTAYAWAHFTVASGAFRAEVYARNRRMALALAWDLSSDPTTCRGEFYACATVAKVAEPKRPPGGARPHRGPHRAFCMSKSRL